jgi:hypothetical protein
MTLARSTLGEIGSRYGSDKFTVHGFQSVYEAFLEPRRDEPIKLFEIGIGGEERTTGGESLLTWQEYLPEASIYGIDTYDKSALDSERLHTFVCSQSDPDGLRKLCQDHGPFDVIIDDGNHRGPDVAIAFFTLFRELTPNGLYFIEDVQTSYWPHYHGSSIVPGCYDTAVRWIKLAVDIINRGEVLDPNMFPLGAGLAVSELHAFHNIAVMRRDVVEVSSDSKILNEELRKNFLSADRAMHARIGGIYAQLSNDPGKLRSLLYAVAAYGGLEKFLADFAGKP